MGLRHLSRTLRFRTRRRFTTTTTAPTEFAQPALDAAMQQLLLCEWDAHDWRRSSDALADWLNQRWLKTGYGVDSRTVCFVLRLHGRDASMRLGDHLGGAFCRD